jgi:hypothetical protein
MLQIRNDGFLGMSCTNPCVEITLYPRITKIKDLLKNIENNDKRRIKKTTI